MADDGLNIALRFGLYVCLASAFGVALFGAYALRGQEQTSLIARRLRVFVGGAMLGGITLSIASLAVLAKTMSGTPSYGDLSIHVFEMLLTGTHVGMAWSVRILALGVGLLLLVLPLRPQRCFQALAAACGLALATLAWVGHGAMDTGLRSAVHLGADIAHLWAAGAWVGALCAFVMLASLPPNRLPDSLQLLSRTSHGFAQWGSWIVATLTMTGAINYLLIVGSSLAPLSSTGYGQLLLVKLALFMAMLALAAANRYRLSPRLKQSLSTGRSDHARRLLRNSLWTETVLALLVLWSVAWLGVLSPQ
ncbi:MAG: copper homeostasis membrane protein CopD [Acidovorax sp.]|jgi:putative copper resistance protein D|nr:copper homeostasis membrane protein CopD [Acidovorax sp.]